MSEKIFIFDEEGSRYEVTNIEALLNELDNDGLELIYKSTRYFHEFNKTILELIERRIIEQTEGTPYECDGVEIGLIAFEGEITKRLGPEKLAKFIAETDAQWEENKPNVTKPPVDLDEEE